jgi:hypothetical protein
MTIRGDLSTMPPADLLDWIYRRELTGTVRATRGGVERRLVIQQGAITLVSCNLPTEYLGQFLLNAASIDEAELRRVQTAQDGSPTSLGKTLIEGNLVTEEDLRIALELKIKECVCDFLSWADGGFSFEPGPPAAKTTKVEHPVAVSLRDAMVEGEPRAQEWKAARTLVPNEHSRFFILDWRAFQDIDARSADGTLLQEVARGLSVQELIQARRALPFTVYRALADLVGRKVIRLDRRKQTRAVPDIRLSADGLLAAAHGRAQGGDTRGALGLARRALDKSPNDTRIQAGCQALERHVIARIAGPLLGKYAVPRLARPITDEAGLSTEEKTFLGRVDGHWDLLTIIQGGPLSMADALLAAHNLVERGLLSLG